MERYRPNTHKIKASTRLSAVTGESMMPKIKINLDLRKIIVDAHKEGNGYIKLSQRFLDRNRLQEKLHLCRRDAFKPERSALKTTWRTIKHDYEMNLEPKGEAKEQRTLSP